MMSLLSIAKYALQIVKDLSRSHVAHSANALICEHKGRMRNLFSSSSKLLSKLSAFRKTSSLASMTNLPSTQLGVLTTRSSNVLQTFPVPSPGKNEVLVQNVAVASNPKDWKIPTRFDSYAFIEGNDVAGNIVKVGEGVTEYKGGERVAAFTKMGTKDNKYGAYAQYSVAPASTTFPIPESTSYEEASTLPLAVMTAAIGLFKRLAIPEPPFPAITSSAHTTEQKGIIINGASSSVGAFAVQLAKRAGLFVVGVAGSSKDYAKSVGADVIVDYREHKDDALVRS
ncbi:chaperonin 10-like protein [Phellopilus nigrolimitatus]|nr:chaperonin 10-like protein [Phellopilus nigrolimitatus]